MKPAKQFFEQQVYDSLLVNRGIELAERYKEQHELKKALDYNYYGDTSAMFNSLPTPWRDVMFGKYKIDHINSTNFNVESPFRAYSWGFSTLEEAEKKVKQLVVWLHGERQRGNGCMIKDVQP